MDAGRHDEEGDRQDRQRDDEQTRRRAATRTGPPGSPSSMTARSPGVDGDDRADDDDRRQEERRPDEHGRDAQDLRGRLAGPEPATSRTLQSAVRGEPVAVVRQQRPRVVGVDRDVRVAAGRLGDLLEQADERRARTGGTATIAVPKADDGARDEAGSGPRRAGRQPRVARWPGAAARQPGPRRPRPRPADAASRTDGAGGATTATIGMRMPSCGLMIAASDREDRRPLGAVAPQLAQAEQQEDHPERVDLAPDRAVEPGDRVDEDEDRAEQRGPASTRRARRTIDQTSQASDDVGQDRRQLDQVADARRAPGRRSRRATGRTGSPGCSR